LHTHTHKHTHTHTHTHTLQTHVPANAEPPLIIHFKLPPKPSCTFFHTNLSPIKFNGIKLLTITLDAILRNPDGSVIGPTINPLLILLCFERIFDVFVNILLNNFTGLLPELNLSCIPDAIFSNTRGTNTNHSGLYLAISALK
jgi:hypothetical protein